MQNGLEADARGCVVEHVPAQATAVERPVGAGEPGTECREDRVVAGLSRGGECVGKAVGVGDVDAERRECVGDRGLAAADASGQADDKGHVKNSLTSGEPKNSAIAPAIAR